MYNHSPVPQKTKLRYSVIFDTNVLIYGNPFRSEVVRLIENFRNHQEVELKYFIPRVVAEEFISKMPDQITKAKKNYEESIKEINGLMKTKLTDLPPTFKEEDIKKAAKIILEENCITILDTPGIDIRSLLEKAVNHKPPFKSKTDAGFKDAVITETLKEHCPGMSNYSSVVFICEDDFFRQYIEGIADELKIKIYKSIDEFESELKLNLLLAGGEEKLVESVSKEAEEVFFHKDNTNTLFHQEAWPELNRKFPTLFSNPKPKPGWYYTANPTMESSDHYDSIDWEPSDKAEYNIFKPLFIEKTNTNILIWESEVVYSQNFERRSRPPEVEPGFLWESAIYTLRFRVRWSVQLTKEAKIDPNTAKVIDVDQIKDTISRWVDFPQTPISGPTTLSGTVISPAPSFSPSPSPSPEDLDPYD